MEASRTEGNHIVELDGLKIEDIAKWISTERHIDLPWPQLARIRQNSGGFPLLLGLWISGSATLDSDQLASSDVRKSVCQEVSDRTTRTGISLDVLRFLHQLSVLQFPLQIDFDPKGYEKITGLDAVTIGNYAEILTQIRILDGNQERPWFRHELIKACIEDTLSKAEKLELHERAAQYYEKMVDEIKINGKVPLAFGLGSAYHLHQAGAYDASLHRNATLAKFAQDVGELDLADESYQRAMDAAQHLGNEDFLVTIKVSRARLLVEWGKLDEAKRIFEEALTYLRLDPSRKDYSHDVAATLQNLANIEVASGNYSNAEHLYDEVLKEAAQIADEGLIARTLSNLAFIERKKGNYDKAEQFINRSLTFHTKSGDLAGAAAGFHMMGEIALDRGRYVEAHSFFNEALENKLEDKQQPSDTLEPSQTWRYCHAPKGF